MRLDIRKNHNVDYKAKENFQRSIAEELFLTSQQRLSQRMKKQEEFIISWQKFVLAKKRYPGSS